MWCNVIPWQGRVLALLVLLIAGSGAGYVAGLTRASSACEVRNGHAQQAAQKAADKETARREGVAQKFEGTRERVRVVYQAIEREVDKNVETNADTYAACGVDDDGLRIWNAANAGDAEALRGGADGAVPGAAAGGIWQIGGLVPQPHPGGEDAQGVPR